MRIAYVADMPTPDEAIRMIEQNGGAAPVTAPGMLRPGRRRRHLSRPCRHGRSRARALAPSRRCGRKWRRHRPTFKQHPRRRIASFPELVALAGEKRDLLTKAALEADVRLVRIEDGRLEVALERSAARTLINDLSRKLEQWTGRRWTVIVSNEAGQPTLRAQNEAVKNRRERAAESDPRVQGSIGAVSGCETGRSAQACRRAAGIHAEGDDLADGGDGDEDA